MYWKKIGLVFRPDVSLSWGGSHATAPTAIQLISGVWRVFFSNRDNDNRSHVGWFDIDLDDPLKGIITIDTPLLSPGPIGNFDGNGIYTTAVVKLDVNRIRLYNVGWNPGYKQPLFFAAIGVAESLDMGKSIDFRSEAPILDRSKYDPTSVTGPYVIFDKGKFRMWYVSGLTWKESKEGLKSFYHIKYAESLDGLSWDRKGLVSIDFINQEETNIARPCVLALDSGYEAWFSYASGGNYRIGNGFSKDGKVFERKVYNQPTLEPSDLFFETEAVCHPMIVFHKGKRFMFYNGNKFGIDGVALAIEDCE